MERIQRGMKLGMVVPLGVPASASVAQAAETDQNSLLHRAKGKISSIDQNGKLVLDADKKNGQHEFDVSRRPEMIPPTED